MIDYKYYRMIDFIKIISCIVQCSDAYCWTSLVLHPGMMHTLVSFLGCVGTLMKASCLDMLLTVAFGGVAGIIAGKWTTALRACHLITTVLHQDFFPECRQDVSGVERVHGGSQRAPVW